MEECVFAISVCLPVEVSLKKRECLQQGLIVYFGEDVHNLIKE